MSVSKKILLKLVNSWQCKNMVVSCTDKEKENSRDNHVLALPNIHRVRVAVEFNASLDTVYVISEAVFTANHLTDTDKQNSTGKYR